MQEKNYTKISFRFRQDVGQRGEMGLLGEQIRQKVFSFADGWMYNAAMAQGCAEAPEGEQSPLCIFRK